MQRQLIENWFAFREIREDQARENISHEIDDNRQNVLYRITRKKSFCNNLSFLL